MNPIDRDDMLLHWHTLIGASAVSVVISRLQSGRPRFLSGHEAMSIEAMDLVWPAAQYLPGYIHALERGWSPDNLRPEVARDHLARIVQDPDRFLAELIDREAKGPPITLPDNSTVPRLPGYVLWMWDGEFCGSIGFRWQPGTVELPSYCLGHVGYSVVPWKRRRGYATRALGLLLPLARAEGLASIELTTDADNSASRRVIEANGGTLIERFHKPIAYGGAESLRFRIVLSAPAPLADRSAVNDVA